MGRILLMMLVSIRGRRLWGMHGNVRNERSMRWWWMMRVRVRVMQIILGEVGTRSATGRTMVSTTARDTRRRRGG